MSRRTAGLDQLGSRRGRAAAHLSRDRGRSIDLKTMKRRRALVVDPVKLSEAIDRYFRMLERGETEGVPVKAKRAFIRQKLNWATVGVEAAKRRNTKPTLPRLACLEVSDG